MSKLQLSQTTLYEILTKKVQSLINTKKEFEKICEQIEEQLQRVEAIRQEPIPVEIEPLQVVHREIISTIAGGFYIPQWLVRSIVAILLSLSVSLFFNYRQDREIRAQRYYIETADFHIQDIEAKLKAKGKKKR